MAFVLGGEAKPRPGSQRASPPSATAAQPETAMVVREGASVSEPFAIDNPMWSPPSAQSARGGGDAGGASSAASSPEATEADFAAAGYGLHDIRLSSMSSTASSRRALARSVWWRLGFWSFACEPVSFVVRWRRRRLASSRPRLGSRGY